MKQNKTKLFALIGVILIAAVMVMILSDKEDEGEPDHGDQTEELDVADVYTDHYHYKEVHNGNVYLIRRIEPGEGEVWTDDNWTDELWRYDKNKEGQKLYACRGLDFRVCPNEKYISVIDNNEIQIIDAEGNKVENYTIQQLSDGQYANDGVISLTMQWSDDGSSFWAGLNEFTYPLMLVKLNIADWSRAGTYDLSELPLGSEFALNPNTGKIVLSDYPVMFDAEAAAEFEESQAKVTLYCYDLAEETLTPVESSTAKMFNPQWIDDSTIEYDNPEGRDRIRYSLES